VSDNQPVVNPVGVEKSNAQGLVHHETLAVDEIALITTLTKTLEMKLYLSL